MQDEYKKQASTSNYSEYKQKLNSEQQKAYESSFSKSYNVNNRMNFDDALRSRPQRINVFNSRPVYVGLNPVYFGSPISYGHAFAGPWDLWFLMRASDLFWYHHWHDISPYRNYFQEQQFRDMERRVQELEAKNNGVRDENYLEPGVDPDLQFSGEYQEKNLDRIYYTDKYSKPVSNPVQTILILIVIAAGLILIMKNVARPRRKKYDSRLY